MIKGPNFLQGMRRRLSLLIDAWSHESIAYYVLPILMVVLIAGTVAQRWIGLYQAQNIFFLSPFIWLGPVPIPGTPCLLAIILVGLFLKFVFRSSWRWANAGTHLAHLGILILLLGGLVTALNAEEGQMTIFEHQRANVMDDGMRALPFAVELVTFTKTMHAGTDKPKSYASDIMVHDGDIAWPVRIEMNKPLRYKGYTLFQSSFVESPRGIATVLAVVRNRGWLLPYLGTLVLSLGLLLHFIITAFRWGRRP